MGRSGIKSEKDRLRARMRAMGMGFDEIALEFARLFDLRCRAAWRQAYGWTLEQAAGHINAFTAREGLDPDGNAGMTGPHLCEYEQWPAKGGRKPTPYILTLLAHVYDTDVRCLLDPEDYEHLSPANRLILDQMTQMTTAGAGPTPGRPEPPADEREQLDLRPSRPARASRPTRSGRCCSSTGAASHPGRQVGS